MAEDPKETLLIKAKEADEEARRALNPKLKEIWTQIAKNYRQLARESGLPDSENGSLPA